MTKVPLRTYLREIEDAIEEGQTDEAVAHCRHILKTFPKHSATYRLLGKAYLEAQRYGSAADIFQRVLSAIPDDFVSHVGMSIVREDEGNIDTALWHMERAFEVQPYNPAIQGEVRRLYGQRDGMEPAKARLTRGALARMYAKGGHYDQAIAELRAALANEPDRSDLQIILADMYVRSGENVKAIETCSTILQKLPFCLPANRLLAKLLQGTEREDESKTYQQRVHALEPYEAHISSHAPTAQDVPEQAVTIDRLSWDAALLSAEPSEQQPEWASSLGVELEQPDSSGDDLPDWLSSASEDSPVSLGDDDFAPATASDDDDIPAWMKDAGWETSSGEAEEGPSPFAFDDADADDAPDSAVAVDLPDWVKDMAPAATAAAAAELTDDDSDDLDVIFDAGAKPAEEMAAQPGDAPDWLGETGQEAKPAPAEAQAAEDIPDWLKGVDDDSPIVAADKAETTGVTDFLVGLGRDQEAEEDQVVEAQPLADDAIPDWLKSPEGEAGTPAEPVDEPEPRPEAAATDAPDWLQGLEAQEPAPQPATEADDIPDWLKSVDEETPAVAAEEPAPQPAATADGDLDWLEGLDEEAPAAQVAEPAPEPAAAVDDVPDWLKSLDDAEQKVEAEESAPAPAAEESAIPDWLDELAEATLAEEGAEEPAPAAKPQASDTPDWLSEISEEEPTAKPESEFRPTPEARRDAAATALESYGEPEITLPAFDGMGSEPQSEPQPEPEAEFPEWLASPDTSDAAAEPTTETPAEDSEFPEWLAPPSEEKPVEEPAAAEFEDADTAMAWLEGLAAKQGVSEEELITQPEDRPETPPDWVGEATPEPAPEFEPKPAAEPAAATPPDDDTPDWLKDIGPADADTVPAAVADTEADADAMAVEEPADTKAEPAPAPTDEFEDADAAMAWLEGLAAKQGVSEEELITKPEERPEAPPDWVQDIAHAPEAEPSEEPSTPDPVGEIVPEDIPEWLQDSAFAPAETEADKTAPPAEETTIEPEPVDAGQADEIPDWLKDTVIEPQSPELAIEPEATTEAEDTDKADDLPDWLKDVDVTAEPTELAAEPDADADAETTTVEAPAEAPADESAALPEWLQDIDTDQVEPDAPEDATWIREFGKDVPSFEQTQEEGGAEEEQPAEAGEQDQDLPDWLQDYDDEKDLPAWATEEKQPDGEEKYTWRPSEPEQPVDADAIAQEKLDLNEASLIELERLPGMGFRRAQAIFSHREEHGPFNQLDDLLVLGIEAETIAGIENLVEVKAASGVEKPVQPEAPMEPATPAALPPVISPEDAEDEYHAKQIGAQSKFSQGDISGAMADYDQLIKKGKRIDQIIADLEASDQARPDDPEILQALGDSYMRADRLQEALDTYSKAEKLLQ
ncbi:MAG: tetratricopeptide repeat protein [Anaerolineales bacterium]|nr:tetratricopeptide repeat protein [Anaerolineales bacterium]